MAPVQKKRGTLFLETAGILVLLILGFMLLLASCENRIIYHPQRYPAGSWNPEEAGVRVRDVHFRAADGTRLHGWYIPASQARGDWLWFHGNAGNITHRLENIRLLRLLRLNIFIFDYRGYGKSEGEPDGRGLSLDARAAYEWLTGEGRAVPDRLFLFGRSLGGVFAIEVAERHPAAGLILESTFTSARDMARRLIPPLPLHWFIRSRFDSLSRIRHLTLPKLFLHGTRDEVVPYELGRKLFNAAPEPKTFYDIQGAGHNDTPFVGGPAYLAALDRFVTRTLEARTPIIREDHDAD